MVNPPGRLEFEIEELVLEGFALGDHYRIARAVQRELVRLFLERGVPSSLAESREVTRLPAVSFEMAPRSTASAIGAQVAQAVYSAISGKSGR